MEDINGHHQEGVERGFRKATLGHRYTYGRYVCICLIPLLAGCSLPKIKSGLIRGASTAATVGVTSALAPGVLVPAVVGGTTAVIASAMTAVPSVKAEPISVTAETVVQAAPDNFWTLLGDLISVGGWALILIVLVPMLFSWLLPGPIQFKKKNGVK